MESNALDKTKNHQLHFKMVHHSIKKQNLELVDLKGVTYAQLPIPLSLRAQNWKKWRIIWKLISVKLNTCLSHNLYERMTWSISWQILLKYFFNCLKYVDFKAILLKLNILEQYLLRYKSDYQILYSRHVISNMPYFVSTLSLWRYFPGTVCGSFNHYCSWTPMNCLVITWLRKVISLGTVYY